MKRLFALLLAAALLLPGLTGCAGNAVREPVTLSLWHVYGSQTQSPLNDLIDRFNSTAGKELGITVNVSSVSDSAAIDSALIAAAQGQPGSPPLPDLFTAYPRVAEGIGPERLLDWSEYLTLAELEAFVPAFLDEGYVDGRLLVLPIAKSTELLFVNRTLFDRFTAATGAAPVDYGSYEALFAACCSYYDWSGGQAMFQLNDFYTYFLVNVAAQGGSFLLDGRPDCSGQAFRAAWLPMARAAIHGGLSLSGGYASDLWQTAELIAQTSSSAGLLYIRDHVTYPDNTTEDIETLILPYPGLAGGDPAVMQRGVGLFALDSGDARRSEAAAAFARWLTEAEHNLAFVTRAGYLPVTDQAFTTLFDDPEAVVDAKSRALYQAVRQMYGSYDFLTLPVFPGAGEVQHTFEADCLRILSAAHETYLRRTAAGEDPETVMAALLDAALAELQAACAA